MNNFKFLIRFGVHKDREVLNNLRNYIDGIIVPAHILCYTTNATIAAISYIQKEYYVDPMTYIFSSDNNIKDYIVVDEKTSTTKFKPSITKLTDEYGLTNIFQKNNYSALKPDDFDDDLYGSLCANSLNLQLRKVDDEKGKAFDKYSELLKSVGEEYLAQEAENNHQPAFIIPPYFYFKDLNDPWLDINLKLAKTISEKNETSIEVAPVIFTNVNNLSPELLEKYKEYKNVFIWVDNFEQKRDITITNSKIDEYKKFAEFVKDSKEKEIRLINLYGSYYSILLGKLGLGGICNGIFYGEAKGRKSAVGGIPQARYYIRDLHEFFGLPEAVPMLKRYKNLIDKDCEDCFKLIDGDPDNITKFLADHSLAQRHFIYSRRAEIDKVKTDKITPLVDQLFSAYNTYNNDFNDKDDSPTNKSIEFLNTWYSALENYKESSE